MKFKLNQNVRVIGCGVGKVYDYNHRYKEYTVIIDGEKIYGVKDEKMIQK